MTGPAIGLEYYSGRLLVSITARQHQQALLVHADRLEDGSGSFRYLTGRSI